MTEQLVEEAKGQPKAEVLAKIEVSLVRQANGNVAPFINYDDARPFLSLQLLEDAVLILKKHALTLETQRQAAAVQLAGADLLGRLPVPGGKQRVH